LALSLSLFNSCRPTAASTTIYGFLFQTPHLYGNLQTGFIQGPYPL